MHLSHLPAICATTAQYLGYASTSLAVPIFYNMMTITASKTSCFLRLCCCTAQQKGYQTLLISINDSQTFINLMAISLHIQKLICESHVPLPNQYSPFLDSKLVAKIPHEPPGKTSGPLLSLQRKPQRPKRLKNCVLAWKKHGAGVNCR